MGIFFYDVAQLWWPEDDKNHVTAFEWVRKYLPDVDQVTKLCKKHRTVVQAGGHVGLWPLRLAKSFQNVITYEVQPSLQECLERNCKKASNITVMKTGLGSHPSSQVSMRRGGSAGSWRIDPAGDMFTTLTTIDDLNLNDCDAIVLDVEGYEVAVLQGAKQTIQYCKPLIYVEELPRSQDAIRDHISRLGYRFVKKVHRDCIYVAA